MPTSRLIFVAGLVAALLLVLVPRAQASGIKYVYTGDPFNIFVGFTCTGVGECGVQGYMVFASPLAADTTYNQNNLTVQNYEFTDGARTFTPADSAINYSLLSLVTDDNGDIFNWKIAMETNYPNYYLTSEDGPSDPFGPQDGTDFNGNAAWVDAAGQWHEVTPEPASWVLFGGGLLALLGLGLRRRVAVR